VFFVFFGLQTDPRQIPAVLLVAVALGLVTAATKVFVGRWASQRSGVGPRGQSRAGAVLMARGEFSIIIAGLGAGLATGADLAALAAAYVLLMAIAGPVAVRVLQTRQERARAAEAAAAQG
jgi:CPA2 family monovalent cation:H+ antiporter-2